MAWRDDEDDFDDDWPLADSDDDPQDRDRDPDDDDGEIATDACNHCGAEIVAALPQCPRCGAWAPDAGGPSTKPRWIIVAAIVAVGFVYSIFRICSFGDR